jgi:hypothetical protein
MRIFEGRKPWNHLNADFLIGRRLLCHEYPTGIASVADLTCELAAILPAHAPVTYFGFPILDGGCPRATELLSNVRAISGLPKPLYVHCAQGHGRTGLVAAAILLAEGNAETVDSALVQIRSARPSVRIDGRQRRALEEFAQLLAVDDARRAALRPLNLR